MAEEAAPRPGKHPLSQSESRECRRSGKQLDGLWAESSNLEFLGRFCTISPQAFQPRDVETHGADEKEAAYFFSGKTYSQQRHSVSARIPPPQPPQIPLQAPKIPSLCLRGSPFPLGNQPTPGLAFPAGLSPSRGRIGWSHW